jgi:hypothetical protein
MDHVARSDACGGVMAIEYPLSSMPDKRTRRTKIEMAELREALYEIIMGNRPLTVRHLFYLAVARSLIEKSEDDYQQVIVRLAGIMREEWLDHHYGDYFNGERPKTKGAIIAFGRDYIVDAGRWIRKPRTYSGIEAALQETAQFYRRDLWDNAPIYIAFLCEKDAIAELVYQETAKWDVPLAVIRGQSSKTFLYENAQVIDELDKETHLYFLGDHDESGDLIIQSAVDRIRRYAQTDKDIYWEKIAVTQRQIADFDLPLRPSKPAKDGRVKAKFASGSVEVDAIPPGELRRIINATIERHVDRRSLRTLEVAEKSERELMEKIAGNLPMITETLNSRNE